MTVGPWAMPPQAVAASTPTYVSVAAQVPPPARASVPPDIDACWRCSHCGHVWTAPERPMPWACPLAFTDDEHAWRYPLGYPY